MPILHKSRHILNLLSASIIAIVLAIPSYGQNIIPQVENSSQCRIKQKNNQLAVDEQANKQFKQALAFTKSGKNEKAKAILNDLIEKNPDCAQLYVNLSIIYAKQSNYDMAREILISALKADDIFNDAYDNLQQINRALALHSYQSFLNKDNDSQNIQIQLASYDELEFTNQKSLIPSIAAIDDIQPTSDINTTDMVASLNTTTNKSSPLIGDFFDESNDKHVVVISKSAIATPYDLQLVANQNQILLAQVDEKFNEKPLIPDAKITQNRQEFSTDKNRKSSESADSIKNKNIDSKIISDLNEARVNEESTSPDVPSVPALSDSKESTTQQSDDISKDTENSEPSLADNNSENIDQRNNNITEKQIKPLVDNKANKQQITSSEIKQSPLTEKTKPTLKEVVENDKQVNDNIESIATEQSNKDVIENDNQANDNIESIATEQSNKDVIENDKQANDNIDSIATEQSNENKAQTTSTEVEKTIEEPIERLAVQTKKQLESSINNEEIIKQVNTTILGWAQAWSKKNVPTFINYYIDDYSPSTSNLTHKQWQKDRRLKISNKKYINVQLSDINIQVSNDQRLADVNFIQSYKSPTFNSTVSKKLTLRKAGDAWKILNERIN